MVCPYATHNNASVSIFKLHLDNHCQVLSLSTLSGIFLTNCPCIFFSRQFCLSSCAFCYLNSPLIAVSSVLIVLDAATPLMKFSLELATKKHKLFSSSLTQRSTLIRLLPPSFLFTYNLSTSLHTLSLFSLFSCPHLSIHSLSTVVFLLRI